ncbi:MAG: hypothetical protein ACK2T6_07285, partial [Anaerolineae bacterium]
MPATQDRSAGDAAEAGRAQRGRHPWLVATAAAALAVTLAMALSYQFIGALISLGLTRSLSDEEFRSYMIDAYAAYSPIYVQACGAPVWIAVW